MKTIKSKDNPIYKAALKLTRKKYRDDTGCYLLEGIKPLKDALDMGISVKTIFLLEGTAHELPGADGIAVMLDEKLFETLSDTGTSQGIIAVAEKRQYEEADFKEAAGGGNVVILDRLQDQGNIGTIIRTAEAAGYGGVIMVKGTGDAYSPKTVRAAAGSVLRMPVAFAESGEHAIGMVRRMGRKLVVTSPDARQSCFDADLSQEIALVIGNEGSGVGVAFLDAADLKIKIPMEGSIESLNAAVAAGIVMYQARKRR